MSLKKKLFTALTMFCLVIAMLMMGVYALSTANVEMGGTISFTAKYVLATVSQGTLSETGSWVTESDVTTKMQETSITKDMTQDDVTTAFESWKGLNLLFNSNGDDVTIKFTVTNDSEIATEALIITASVSGEDNTNSTNATIDISPASASLASGKSQEFTVTFSIIDGNYDAKLDGFKINLDMGMAEIEIPNASEYSYLTFSYDDATRTASVAECDTSVTAVTVPGKINYNGKTYTVTSIGEGAFWDCFDLTGITLSPGLISIGDYAFSYCVSLESIIIPEGVTTIGEHVFDECESLTNISIPNSITSISNLGYCFPEYELYEGVKYLGNETNQYLVMCGVEDTSLTTYTINSSCKILYEESFYDCSSLTEITIPNSVISIGERAFYGCDELTSIDIPESVTSIGSSAFQGCSKLTTVIIDSETIANSLTSKTANGYLINYATTIYIKTGLTVGSYVADTTNFPNVETITTGDYAGYTKYSK